ncbi:EC1118_1L7_2179p [Saccharomyces cerevisiae EC1118]|uniref:EC1118_1L7_2179p n=2 Tax=Saccharomyces TaxID=4930 RepID=C8ZDV7_YEAS8|nr:EC1118_1L7_2179p [Saccharomyces cerevisiae EC1118]
MAPLNMEQGKRYAMLVNCSRGITFSFNKSYAPNLTVVYVHCLNTAALRPEYNPTTPSFAKILSNILKSVGLGIGAACSLTLAKSRGCVTMVAKIPAAPPYHHGYLIFLPADSFALVDMPSSCCVIFSTLSEQEKRTSTHKYAYDYVYIYIYIHYKPTARPFPAPNIAA